MAFMDLGMAFVNSSSSVEGPSSSTKISLLAFMVLGPGVGASSMGTKASSSASMNPVQAQGVRGTGTCISSLASMELSTDARIRALTLGSWPYIDGPELECQRPSLEG